MSHNQSVLSGSRQMILRLSLVLFLCFLNGAASGQTLPNHADPSAREEVPNLSAVPAIRFLTTADFPPFNYRDANGQLIGFHVDLAQAICEIVTAACTIQAWPWDQAADALADNQGDALIAGLAISEENGQRFDFSHVYLALPARFVTREAEAGSFDPGAFSGSIGVRDGSAHEIFLERYIPHLRTTPFPTEIAALDALKSGEIDAYFGDAMRASFWLNDNLDCCAFAGEAYFRPDLFGEGFAITMPAGSASIRQAIDWALLRLKRDGILDELYLRWFPISFY